MYLLISLAVLNIGFALNNANHDKPVLATLNVIGGLVCMFIAGIIHERTRNS